MYILVTILSYIIWIIACGFALIISAGMAIVSLFEIVFTKLKEIFHGKSH